MGKTSFGVLSAGAEVSPQPLPPVSKRPRIPTNSVDLPLSPRVLHTVTLCPIRLPVRTESDPEN